MAPKGTYDHLLRTKREMKREMKRENTKLGNKPDASEVEKTAAKTQDPHRRYSPTVSSSRLSPPSRSTLSLQQSLESEKSEVDNILGAGSLKDPIRLKDAVGRKFSFPWQLCKTWQGMEELIKQAFVHVDVLGEHVQRGHYDLTGPDGEIILPQVWEMIVQPGWEISMHMWPMPEDKKDRHTNVAFMAADPLTSLEFDDLNSTDAGIGRRKGKKKDRKGNKKEQLDDIMAILEPESGHGGQPMPIPINTWGPDPYPQPPPVSIYTGPPPPPPMLVDEYNRERHVNPFDPRRPEPSAGQGPRPAASQQPKQPTEPVRRWSWDPERAMYYRYSKSQNAYVYREAREHVTPASSQPTYDQSHTERPTISASHIQDPQDLTRRLYGVHAEPPEARQMFGGAHQYPGQLGADSQRIETSPSYEPFPGYVADSLRTPIPGPHLQTEWPTHQPDFGQSNPHWGEPWRDYQGYHDIPPPAWGLLEGGQRPITPERSHHLISKVASVWKDKASIHTMKKGDYVTATGDGEFSIGPHNISPVARVGRSRSGSRLRRVLSTASLGRVSRSVSRAPHQRPHTSSAQARQRAQMLAENFGLETAFGAVIEVLHQDILMCLLVAAHEQAVYKCFAIVSPEGNGSPVVLRPVDKRAVIFAGSRIPTALSWENIIQPPIRVRCLDGCTLRDNARLDLSRVYSVDIGDISRYIGHVHQRSRLDFDEAFAAHWLAAAAANQQIKLGSYLQQQDNEQQRHGLSKVMADGQDKVESKTEHRSDSPDENTRFGKGRSHLGDMPAVTRVTSKSSGADVSLPRSSPTSPVNDMKDTAPVPALDSLATNDIQLVDDLDDIDALLDPVTHFAGLDDLEMDVFQRCHVEAIFPRPGQSQMIRKGAALYCRAEELDEASGQTVRDHCRVVLFGILSALDQMRQQGFCGDCINIIVDDEARPNVARVVDIEISDIMQISELIGVGGPTDGPIILESALRLLDRLGATCIASDSGEEVTAQRPQPAAARPKVGEVITLLCSVLALAVCSYSGSHCSNIGQLIWGAELSSIAFDRAQSTSGKPFGFRQQRLACLDRYIGGPIWVFGSSASTAPARLSVTITQLAALWGPIIAIPSAGDATKLLALQTDDGVMFQTSDTSSKAELGDKEVLMHWIASDPIRQERQGETFNKRAVISHRSAGERLPARLDPFPTTSRLLIGHLTAPTSCTTTSSTLNITLSSASALSVNEHCQLDITRYAETCSRYLHPLGTYEAYYIPEEYQLDITAGQYVMTGLSKTWKRTPARTWKARLLMKFADQHARPNDIRKLCQLRVGLERSCCTENAQRVSLCEALMTAFPLESSFIQTACDAGRAADLAPFLVDLGATGVDHRDRLLFFWPFSGLPDALEAPTAKPQWRDFLKDGRDTACFAVISPRCLTYYGRDDVGQRRIRALCSCQASSSRRGVLHTTVALDPQSHVRLPLAPEARIRLADGYVEVRNKDSSAQLAFYERRNFINKMEEMAICVREGSRGHSHHEHLAVHRAARYPLPVCIVDA